MPTNLNALIRYKRIDACLKNPYVACTIERLQETCSEAMGEFRGIYKLISERTIRDDIRVLRSNILGFNAPIKFEDGKYVYTEKDYSIFQTPVTEVDLLKDILNMLLEERNNIADTEIDMLLRRISIIIGEPIPFEITEYKMEYNSKKSDLRKDRPLYSLAIKYEEPAAKSIGSADSYYYDSSISEEKEIEALLMWNEILGVLF